jgi:hypothetical protein
MEKDKLNRKKSKDNCNGYYMEKSLCLSTEGKTTMKRSRALFWPDTTVITIFLFLERKVCQYNTAFLHL